MRGVLKKLVYPRKMVNLGMKIVEFDLDKDNGLDSLSRMLKDKGINAGIEDFQLHIHFSHKVSQVLYAGFLLLLAKYFIEERNNSDTRDVNVVKEPEFVYGTENDYFLNYFKYSDVNRIKEKIEKDFHVQIEEKKKNPLDEVFGIWKEEDITLEDIRKKAWQRTK